MNQRSSGISLWAALAILAVGVGLRLMAVDRPLWLDEHATWLAVGETLSQTWTRLRSDTHHPLYFLLFNGLSHVSHSLSVMRLLSVLFDTLSMGVLMLWLRRYNLRAALYAALFFATSPMLLRFGVEIRPYSLLSLTSLLTLWAMACVVEDRPRLRNYAALAASSVLLVATQPVGAMLLAVLGAWPVMHAWRYKRPVHGRALAVALLPAVLLFAYFHWVWALPHPPESIAWMPPMSWSLFSGTMRYLFIDASVGVPPLGVWLQQGTWAALWLVFFVWAREGDWRFAALAGAFLLLVAGYSVVREPIFWYRPLLPAMLVLMVHLALQIERLGWLGRSVWLALCGVQAAAWCMHAHLPVEPQTGPVLQESWQAGDTVLYYPAFMRLYVLDEAPFVPAAAMAPLTVDGQLPNPETGHAVHVIMRTDIPLAQSRAALEAGVEHWRPVLQNATDIELLVISGHDLLITEQTGVTAEVVDSLTARLGQAVVEPRQDGLLRVHIKPRHFAP